MKKFATVMILLAGAFWGATGIFVRHLTELGLQTADILAFRSVVTAIVLFNFCYFKTITLTSLSVAAVMLYTAPSMVMVLALFFFKEKLTTAKVIAVATAFLGCVFVTGVFSGQQDLSAIGILFGLGSGLGYALYSIFSRFALEKGYHALTITAYTFVIAALGTVPFANVPKIIQAVTASPQEAAFSVGFCVLVTVIPYLLFTLGLNHTEAGQASVTASVEPVCATLIGMLVFGEQVTVFHMIGILLVLASIVILNLKPANRAEKRGRMQVNPGIPLGFIRTLRKEKVQLNTEELVDIKPV